MSEIIDNAKPKSSDFTIVKTLITPEIARKYLEHNTLNRPASIDRVNMFADLMRAGLFQTTPHGIIFDCDGVLVDGQSRLSAIVKTGCAVYMMVSRGVPPECRLAIDNGRIRNSVAIAHITGRTSDTSVHYSIAKNLKLGPDKAAHKKIPEAILQQWVDQLSEPIAFVIKHSKGKRIPALIQSVIARAWYTKDREKLVRFIEVYSSGVTNGQTESAATKLRDMVASRKFTGKVYVTHNGNTIPSHRAFHEFTENALDNFLTGFPVQVLKRGNTEKFPIPSEVNGWNGNQLFS